MLKCADDTIYTGISTDPYRRLKEHNFNKGAKYTKYRGPHKLVGIWYCKSETIARKTEYTIKQKSRKQKLEIIKTTIINIDGVESIEI